MRAAEDMLREAVAAYQAGRFAEAEVGYRQVLRARPTSHLALYGLALLSYHAGAKVQAIDFVRRSLRFEPNVGLTWNWLGTLYIETDRPVEGSAAFKRATDLSPELCEAWCNRADCLIRDRDLDGAAKLLYRALACPLPQSRAFESLADVLRRLGRVPEAAQTVSAWLVREPTNPIALHMAAAFSGRDSPYRATDEYVRTHFDGFADGFDSVLKSLNYRGPQLVTAALRAAASRDSMPLFPAILDAGCGTGLCGPHVRELCARLVGVDLSPKMLHHAQQRGCYDELVTAELGAFMRSRPQTFDAIVCADTFIYFGTLAEALTGAHTALRVGGPLVFTVEALPQGDPADHRLGVSGRYLHSETYLRRVIGEAGFMVESVAPQTARENAGKDVPGYLVVARHQ
ncbi:MAG TPA: tetratricopeptide repeat protein [Steroidobacteraceae bacterium]|nr:tetratricopeptide repeat protein [Steroidobacteraceae bacterium]